VSALREIDGAAVLKMADLTHSVATGRTRHVVGEEEVSDFSGLAIVRYEGEPGVYLLYCNADWSSITDTYHDSVEGAIEQAEFEFEPVLFVDPPSGE